MIGDLDKYAPFGTEQALLFHSNWSIDKPLLGRAKIHIMLALDNKLPFTSCRGAPRIISFF